MRDRSTTTFLIVVMAIALPVTIVVLLTDQLALHARINQFHAGWADVVFRYGTHLADGWVTVGIGLALMCVRWRWFMLFAVSTLGSALIAQLLKRTFFADHDRPSTFIAEMPDLRLIPGVEMLHHNSFPSGHSTCAFSMCFALAIIIGRPGSAAAMAVLAVFLGFSRVYLSQHFTEDVLCGAMIGTGTTWLAYRWVCTGPFARKEWLDRSLLRRQNQ